GTLCGVMAQGIAQAGAHTILVGRSEEKAKERLDAIQQAGGTGSFLSADVADRAAIQGICDQIIADHGTVDILVNGAGVNSPTPYIEIEDEEFQRIVDINTGAVFRACQIFGRTMLEQENGGTIINIGSISGLGPLSRVFTYSLSKAAVHNLTKNLAREWAEQGIRVNTLVPGFFPAEQNRKVLTDDRIAQIMNHTAMNRFGEAEELIGATLLLCSPAGSFITGHEMIVDGGFSSMTI
ncbi:MAG: SDR family oxidoreductase, partial [Verrucomicrobiota bacterium]